MRAIFTLIITVIIGAIPSGNNNENSISLPCSVELTVEKNRTFKSVDKNGADFKITVKNTSQQLSSFELTTSQLLEPCSNQSSSGSAKSALKNVNLDVSLKMNNEVGLSKTNNNKKNIIILEAGQSKEFTVHAVAPEGTPFYTWGCIEVKASSIECESVSAEKILSIYVPDPSEK